MRRTICALLIAWASISSAAAQDITWHIGEFKLGSYVVIKTMGNGHTGTYKHLYKGKSGKLFLVATMVGKSTSQDSVFVSYMDRMGNVVKVVRPDGSMIRYVPHDCKRVEGTCKYTEIKEDGRRFNFVRMNTPEPGGFSFKIFDVSKNLVRYGQQKLDEFGTAGDGWQKGQKGEDYRYKKVEAVYK